METETETAMSTGSRESEEDAQSTVDHYINGMIDFVIERPFASIPRISEFVAQGGPCASPRNNLHLMGGPGMFRRICRRMESMRWAPIRESP